MTISAQLTPGQARTAIALAALRVRARQQRAERGPLNDGRHRLADLTGQPAEVIVEAAFAAISAAHAEEWATEQPIPDGLCPSCMALIDLASRYGDPTGQAWPDPVRRVMADVLDEWIAGQEA